MKLHPGLKDMIKTRALSLRLRFFDTMTDKAALKQATKEELALEPRDWSWWRPPSRKQIKHAAAELTRLLNQPPPEPPFIIRTRAAAEPAVNKVKKKQSITQRLAAAVSTSMSTSPTPPLVPTPEQQPAPSFNPGVYVHHASGGRPHGPALDLQELFEADPRFQPHDRATSQWRADQKRTDWK